MATAANWLQVFKLLFYITEDNILNTANILKFQSMKHQKITNSYLKGLLMCYILNVQHSDSSANPIVSHTVNVWHINRYKNQHARWGFSARSPIATRRMLVYVKASGFHLFDCTFRRLAVPYCVSVC